MYIHVDEVLYIARNGMKRCKTLGKVGGVFICSVSSYSKTHERV